MSCTSDYRNKLYTNTFKSQQNFGPILLLATVSRAINLFLTIYQLELRIILIF